MAGENFSFRRTIAAMMCYVILAVLALLYTAPILYMVVSSFKPDDRVLADGSTILAFLPVEASLTNYADVFRRIRFSHIFFNSIFITGMIMAGSLIVNSLAGYALARLRWRGRRTVLTMTLALLIIPFETIAVPLFYQMSIIGWRDSYQVQIVPFLADAFSIFLFYSFFIGLPRELEEAARMDGAGPWRTFLLIIVPLSKPVFATVAILTFLMRWGSYLWPLMVTTGETYRPLPVAMAAFENQVKLWGDIMAFGVMMVAPILIIFLLCQRWFVQGVASTGTGRKE
ncbi:MAG: carbohydrate ABC transporter permease [Desulfobulbaceae bacterium]|nr:carbohydrate ABC transporter permease [Desulfobulbaceae bacterium]